MADYLNNLNNVPYTAPAVAFEAQNKSAVITEPIDKITNKIEEESKKHYNKQAITVGVVVTVVTGLVALLNPRYSKKFAQKIHQRQIKISDKIRETRNSKFVNGIYKAYSAVTMWFAKGVNFVNNVNPMKDTIFKNYCTKEKEFAKVKDPKTKNLLQKIDKQVVKCTSKFHNGITNLFDKISVFTVKNSYKKSAKELDKLENFLRQNLDKVSKEERAAIEKKLAEISQVRVHFNEQNVVERLGKQQSYMSNLKNDFMKQWEDYKEGYRNRWVRNGDNFINNLYYWPEEILKSSREKVENAGNSIVEKLISTQEGKKGAYDEIIEKISAGLNDSEKQSLGKLYKNAKTSLEKANHNECVEYFDKKRDLVLGSAPTDVFSAVTLLTIAGIALASADEKQRRLSRLVTGVIPAIAGLGVSIGMTAALISGGKSLMYGLIASAIVNRIGILVDKYLLGNKAYYENTKSAKLTTEKEEKRA